MKKFVKGEIVEVDRDGAGVDSGMVGTVIDWNKVPMRYDGIPDIIGHYNVPDRKKEIPFRTIHNQIIIMFNDRLKKLDVNKKEHWRISKTTTTNQYMLVTPYPTSEGEAHKYRLKVNTDSGAVCSSDVAIHEIGNQWIPVSWKDIPNHIRKDFKGE